MNANQIINMVVRMVMRRVLRSGVDAGINAVTKRKSNSAQDGDAAPAKPVANSGSTAKRMRQTMRLGRKIGRM